jgi:hypothetical protein
LFRPPTKCGFSGGFLHEFVIYKIIKKYTIAPSFSKPVKMADAGADKAARAPSTGLG